MSVIKLEVPADNQQALSAAASFFTQLSGTKQATVAVFAKPDEPVVNTPMARPEDVEEQDNSDDDTAEPSAPTILNGVEVDVNGLPWDKRIHSGAKSKVKDGSWKLIRGVDKDLVATVEAELRQNMQAQPVPDAPEVKADPVPDAPAPTAEVKADPVPEAPAPAASTATLSFPEVMKVYASAKTKGVLTDADAMAWATSQGLKGLPGLAISNDAMRVAFRSHIEALAVAANVQL